MSDYKRVITAACSQEEAYVAITHKMSEWWSQMSATFDNVGSRATVTFEGMKTYWSFEAISLERPHLVVLKCIESHHIHLGQPDKILTEWLNTKLIFKIDAVDGGCQVEFTHEGLNQELVCFDVCENGWDHFIGESLRDYLQGRS